MVAGGYVVTAVSPSAVSQCLRANFTSSEHTDLVLGKHTLIEVFTLRGTHLELSFTLPVNGGLESLLVVSPPQSELDLLFMCTTDLQCSLLAFHPSQRRVVTVWSQDLGLHFSFQPVSQFLSISRTTPERDHVLLSSDYGHLILMSFQFEGVSYSADAGCTASEVEVGLQDYSLDEGGIEDIVFIYSSTADTQRKDSLTFAALHSPSTSDRNASPQLATYDILLKKKALVRGSLSPPNSVGYISLCAPLPGTHGIVLVSQRAVQVSRTSAKRVVQYDPDSGDAPVIHPPQAYAAVPGKSALLVLTQASEVLYIDVAISPRDQIVSVTPVACGIINAVDPVAITILTTRVNEKGLSEYLSFVASEAGPSSLIVVCPDANAGQRIRLVRTFESVCSVRSLVVTEKSTLGHQREFVTCSGTGKAGAIRALRPSLVVADVAKLDQEGVMGVWAISVDQSHPEQHSHMILGFVSETRVLSLMKDDVEEVDLPGLVVDEATRHVTTSRTRSHLIQISEHAITLIGIGSAAAPDASLFTWPSRRGIVLHAIDDSHTHIVVTFGGADLLYLQISGNRIDQVQQVNFGADVAAIAFGPSPMGDEMPVLFVGSWNSQVISLVALTSLKTLYTLQVPVTGQIKSIYANHIDSVRTANPTVLIGTGDGKTVVGTWRLPSITEATLSTAALKSGGNGVASNEITLEHIRHIPVGNAAVSFFPFVYDGEALVYVCADIPKIVRVNDRVVTALPANALNVTSVATFQVPSNPGQSHLASVTSAGVRFGPIEALDRLSIRTVPLRATPLRLSYHSTRNIYVVLVEDERKLRVTAGGGSAGPKGGGAAASSKGSAVAKKGPYSLMLSSAELTGATKTHPLSSDYTATALCTARLQPVSSKAKKARREAAEYVCVASFIPPPPESRALPSSGHVELYAVTALSNRNPLTRVASLETSGAAYAMCEFEGMLLVGVEHEVHLYEQREDLSLAKVTSIPVESAVCIAGIDVHPPFVMVTDIVQSCTELVYDHADRTFKPIASDIRSLFPPCPATLLSPDWAIGGDANGAMFVTMRRGVPVTAQPNTPEGPLNPVSQFHVGDSIRAMSRIPNPSCPEMYPTVFSTFRGQIGIAVLIDQPDYDLFSQLQSALRRSTLPTGGLSHKKFRDGLPAPFAVSNSEFFIDGDLIAQYPKLPTSQKHDIASDLGMSIEDVTSRINTFHHKLLQA